MINRICGSKGMSPVSWMISACMQPGYSSPYVQRMGVADKGGRVALRDLEGMSTEYTSKEGG